MQNASNPILDYRGRDLTGTVYRRVFIAAWMIITLGTFTFLLGTGGVLLMLIESPWHMPIGDIVGGFAMMGAFLATGAALLVLGLNLRRAKRWAAIGCIILLGAIEGVLIAVLIAIALDWYWYPDYPYWVTYRVVPALFAVGFFYILGALMMALIKFVRHRIVT